MVGCPVADGRHTLATDLWGPSDVSGDVTPA